MNLEELKELNAYQLADMAECGTPADQLTDGASFLVDIRDDILLAFTENELGDYPDDTLSEVVDGNIPVYTYRLWRAFTDLDAFNEDASELGYTGADMTAQATACLYLIGSRLAYALKEELAGE